MAWATLTTTARQWVAALLKTYDRRHSSAKYNEQHDSVEGESFILKRVLAERGEAVRLSGLREAYFGRLFAASPATAPAPAILGHDHLVRFVESFQVSMPRTHDQASTKTFYAKV